MGRNGAGGVDGLAEEVRKYPGVEIHGKSLRIVFMYRRQRCRESLGIEVTKSNIKHAAQLRSAIQHEIKLGNFDYGKHFPDSNRARDSAASRSIRLLDLRERYWRIKVTDLTSGTERRYVAALDVCCEIVGKDLLSDTLMPEDIDTLRSDLIATRKPSTVNHYLATFAGMMKWAKSNGFIERDLAEHCRFFENVQEAPDPLSFEEFKAVIEKGCIHPQDVALVTLCVYTGIRPGELCGLAREDVEGSRLHIRRSLTDSGKLKVTKTKKERVICLVPPAQDAVAALMQMTAHLTPEAETVELSRHQTRVELLTPLVTPLQARNKAIAGTRIKPQSWANKWENLARRAEIRYRRVYQTRHTFACWSLTAHGNIAFIANQMGHSDYTMLVKVYGRWMDSESQKEADFIWQQMQNSGAFAPTMPQEITSE